MTTRNLICVSFVREIADSHVLGVRFVFVSFSSVTGVETHLRCIKESLEIDRNTIQIQKNSVETYKCRHSALASVVISTSFNVSRPAKMSIIKHGICSNFISYYDNLESICLEI